MTMTLLSVDHLAIYGLLALLAWATVSDACSLTIPNRILLAIIALYPAWAFAAWPAADPVGGGIAAAGLLLAGGALAMVVLPATLLRRSRAVVTGGDGESAAAGGSVFARPIPYGIAIAFGGADIALRLIVP